jgi:isoquinoline 1-oxidoreductase beta subunit
MNTNQSRRDFIRISGLAGSGLLLGLSFVANSKTPAIINCTLAEAGAVEFNPWIKILPTGKVILLNHKAEMGQGAFQVVPHILAEELEVDLKDIEIQFAPGDPKYGGQITGGSSTVRGAYQQLLKLGATAREMLISAAATKWNVPASSCYAENSFVIHKPTGRKEGFGALAEAAGKQPVPAHVHLKKRSEYKIIGKPIPRQDTPLKTNGAAIFGLDKKLPGMLYAVVERNPLFLGKVKSFDDTATRKIPGVRNVVKVQMNVFAIKREGVAVVADNTWAAIQGRKALKVEWDNSGFEHHSTESLYKAMHASLNQEGLLHKAQGNLTTALAKSEKQVDAVYETPYEAHSCMEPLNCVAHYQGDKCEIWGPIQGPDWVQSDISTWMGLKRENVIVNMTFLGGGFGRKAFLDYPHEAVVISKEISAPVQVVWTREDDTTQGPFRPGAVYGCKAGISGGQIKAFDFKMAAQNMDHQNPGADISIYNGSVIEGFPKPYLESIPHYRFGDIPLPAPVPVMWWRSVYSSTNCFAYESFLDELAIAAAQDPLDFRRRHLFEQRYQDLITKLEEVTNWKNRKKGEGYGVAVTECFGSIVGEVVKVSRNASNKITIDKVWAVMDCGWYVNPDVIAQQVEGSVIMAIGAATVHAINFKDGMAVEKNFDVYKMPRITQTPVIEVHVMDNEERAGGVGEPSLPPLAAALTNAIFDLTGKRIRKLPFSLENV